MKHNNCSICLKRIIILFVLLSWLSPLKDIYATEKTVESLQNEIDSIDLKLNFLKIKVDEQKKKSQSFEKRMKNAEQQVRDLESQIKQLSQNQTDTILQIQKLENDNRESKEQLKELLTRFRNRLVQLHKIKQGTLVSSVLFAKDLNTFLNRYQMVKYLLESDKVIIEELKAKEEKVKRISQSLQEKNKALESGKKEIAEKQKKFAKEQAYLKEMLNAALLNKKEYLKQENLLSASRKELNKELQEIAKIVSKPEFEQELNSNQGGAISVTAIPAAQEDSPKPSTNNEIQTPRTNINKEESFSATSPEAAKLMNFMWPISKELREKVYEKGDENSNALLIKPFADTEVVAVAKGKVLYKGFLTGLGNLVILGHQRGFSSVYAKLSNVEVGLNEVVEKGSVVGKIDGGDPNGILHFEIRFCGKKMPPLSYLPQ